MKWPKLELGTPDPRPLCFPWFSLFLESELQLPLENWGCGGSRTLSKPKLCLYLYVPLNCNIIGFIFCLFRCLVYTISRSTICFGIDSFGFLVKNLINTYKQCLLSSRHLSRHTIGV